MERETRTGIMTAVVNEMVRIFFFLVYYVALIVLGMVILIGAFKVSCYLGAEMVSHPDSLLPLYLLLCIIGVWAFALMIGIYLIKPLFSFHKDENGRRVEVSEDDCPELFAVISDVARSTRCQMPKHVFLTPDVNACVFYDTSFWSIFLPVRKNLEIGLGLFDGTSVEELKAIIAHEFGHFSQSSMRVGSTVYVTNTVLYNLIFTRDMWDRWLGILDRFPIVCYFSRLTRFLTHIIGSVTVLLYKSVQKGYLKLSRFMEYDADDIAVSYVGKETFASALCKVDALSSKDGLFKRMLNSLMREKKIVSNYFISKDEAYRLIPGRYYAKLSCDVSLKEPFRMPYYVASKVRAENVWASHPSLDDRIANINRSGGGSKTVAEPKPSWALIPDKVARQVSDNFIEIIKSGAGETLTPLSDKDFEQWVVKEVNDNFMDDRLVPFFSATIYEIDLDKADYQLAESPFTDANAMKIALLNASVNDYHLLEQIRDKEVDAAYVEYDGVIYSRKHLPIEELKGRIDALYDDVLKIYSDIYAFVKGRIDDGDRLRNAYEILFAAGRINNDLMPRLAALRNGFVEAVNSLGGDSEKAIRQRRAWCDECESRLKNELERLNVDALAKFDFLSAQVSFLRDYSGIDNSGHTETEVLNCLNNTISCVDSIHHSLHNVALRTICDDSKDAIAATEAPS